MTEKVPQESNIGNIGGIEVHWVPLEPGQQEYFSGLLDKGILRLDQLMMKNAYTVERLTDAELEEAKDIIAKNEPIPGYTPRACNVKGKPCLNREVGDIGMCAQHALEQLHAR